MADKSNSNRPSAPAGKKSKRPAAKRRVTAATSSTAPSVAASKDRRAKGATSKGATPIRTTAEPAAAKPRISARRKALTEDVRAPGAAVPESELALLEHVETRDALRSRGVPGRELSASEAPVPTESRMADFEARLDELLEVADASGDDPTARRRAAEALNHIAARLEGRSEDVDDPRLLGSAREMFSTDFYFRQWGKRAVRARSEDVDEFGLNPAYAARVQPLFDAVFERYFRTRVDGIEHVPAQGRCLLVCNHSGTVPLDGVMLKTAFQRDGSPRRDVRWLAEDLVFHFPFLGAFMNRIGAVRACQENAERLLAQDRLVAVFPEGIQGIGKLYSQRYQLQRFGRGGHVKLALRTNTPIIPVAIVGGEDTHPLLMKLTHLARPLGVPYVPVTPLFPWLGPVGLMPLPSRWEIHFGEPLDLGGLGPDAADDAIAVHRLNERLRSVIQEMLEAAVTRRGPVYFA